VIPPRTGRNHLLHLIAELTKPSTAGSDGRSTDLDAMLRLTASTARRRGLIFVVSDFISDSDWQPALTRLAQRHEVVAVRVVDPAETDLPDVGLVVVEDSETGEQLFADTGDPVFRDRLRAQVRDREAALASAMHRAGAVSHQVDTGEDLTAALIDMVRRSKRRRA